MTDWLLSNSGTLAVLLVLLVIVLLIIRNLLRNKNGISGCGGNCAHCGAGCVHSESAGKTGFVRTTVHIDGMSCAMCESHINDTIRSSFKIRSIKTYHTSGVSVILSDTEIDTDKLRSLIGSLGYTVKEIKIN